MSHTPGPWKVDHDGPSRPVILTADRNMLSISQFLDGRWTTYDREEEDARLIAAAPDLLKACKMALNDRMYKDWPVIADFLIAAIAKAEGTDGRD